MSETTTKKRGMKKMVGGAILLLALLLIVLQVKSCGKSKSADTTTNPTHPTTPPAPAAPTEALVLMKECLTPCKADIQWKFLIRTDGDPLRIKFQGVREWYSHPGKGNVSAPEGVKRGDTEFVSADDTHPNVGVWVYQVENH